MNKTENNPISPITYNVYNEKNKKRKKPSVIKKILKFFFSLILIIIIIALLGMGYLAYKVYEVMKDTDLDTKNLKIMYENSSVYDSEGNFIAMLNGDENRVSITMDEMSEYLPKAFVAIEDERFYDHVGIDIKRTAGATYTYIKNKYLNKNGTSYYYGGSTITQQLIKNLTHEDEDTWKRKVREMTRAYYLEQEMTKDEILELYLNLIFLGDTVYGVEQGSNYYFNKGANELSLAESAFLAGINNSPNNYNPFVKNNGEVLIKINNRTKTVLAKMYELESITKYEYDQACKEVDNGLKFEKGTLTQTLLSYHTDAAINQIIEQLEEENSWSYEQAKLYLFSGGFKIYTTVEPALQEKMQNEFNKEEYKKTSKNSSGNVQTAQAAMVLIENETGYVKAVCGSLDEKTTAFGFDRATDAKRQTGSSMKPIAVLAPSINEGIITASTIFYDGQTSFNNGKYNPKDYANYYRGLITTREAIAYSQNIPMVKTMCLLTPAKSIEFMKKAGITSLDETKDNVLPLALGGLTYGITPLEMAGAYMTIANNGMYIEPTFYSKVVDSEGNVAIEPKQIKEQIMSTGAAFVVKEILTEPVKTGTATFCTIGEMSVAAKTGTTNDDYDRWLCGFTPYYTATVWYGYDNNASVEGWNINPAAQIWINVMRNVHDGKEIKTFEENIPEDVVTVRVCKKTGFLATSTCENCGTAYTEYFVKGTEPIQNCPYHSYAKVCTESGLLATENCPHTKNVYGRGEYINSNGMWSINSYYNVTNVPLQRCNIH